MVEFILCPGAYVSSKLWMAMRGSLNPFAYITSCFSPSPFPVQQMKEDQSYGVEVRVYVFLVHVIKPEPTVFN